MKRAILTLALCLALGPAWPQPVPGADHGFAAPPPRARCPVCGMFVEPHAAWWAQVVLADGGRETFDGVKDLVRWLAEPQRFTPARGGIQVATVWVTDYYTVVPIPAETAFYVVGSDVAGPMGREFVPFSTRATAEEFLRDHRGSAILTFTELPGHRLE